MFREMRRFKQKTEESECIELLTRAKRGILAVLGDEDYPYTVPMDFVYENGKLYFHCAKSGHKIDAVRKHDKVSFCVLSEGVPEPDSWWFHFTSVVVFGRIRVLEDPDKIMQKLFLFGSKYMPTEEEVREEIASSSGRVAMLELDIEHMSGKRVKEN